MPLEREHPSHFGVPHDSFRDSQWDAIDKAHSALKNPSKKFIFAEAPTGVGKTAIAAALGRYEKVTVYVSTLGLLDQYRREYGFAGVKGSNNYPCVLPKKVEAWKAVGTEPTAMDCHFDKMWDCPVAQQCSYLIEKQRAIKAQRTVVTYAYGSLSRSIMGREGILVMDEGHGAAEHILDFANFTITEHNRQRLDLPEYPSSLWKFGNMGKGAILKGEPLEAARGYLIDCREAIVDRMVFFPEVSEEYSKLQKASERFTRALQNFDESTWFLECNPWISWDKKNGQQAAGFRLRALDARMVAKRFWKNKKMVLVMSATIGNPDPLASKLGINTEGMEHHVYEHPIPIAYRPVHNLHMQRMTYTNLKKYPNLYQIQAVSVANFINDLPPEWRGIVLTSSYTKIGRLSAALQNFLPDRRLIVQVAGGKGVDALTEQFITDRKEGDVLVASIQGFGEGLDLRGELARFAVVAGVPFDNPTDPYIQAMRGQAGGSKYLLAKTYAAIPQACGRVTRATKEDSGEWRLNVAAVADGSATTKIAKKYYPHFFREALENTNGKSK